MVENVVELFNVETHSFDSNTVCVREGMSGQWHLKWHSLYHYYTMEKSPEGYISQWVSF